MESLVLANIRQRPVRALVSAAGVALGVCLVMLFTGLTRGMSNDLHRRSSNIRAEIIFTRPGSNEMLSSGAQLSVRYAELLREIEGVESAVPSIRYISQGGRGFGYEQIEGVDWEPFARMNGMRLVSGRPPVGLDEVVIDETKARNNSVEAGGTLRLFGDLPYKVVGVYTPEAGPRVKMSLAAMQDAMERPDRCTWIYVKAREGVGEEELARRITSEPRMEGNKIQFTRDVFTNVEKSIPYLGVFLRTLVVLSAVVSALVVMLAMYTTITERTREIGVLKALGASRGYIVGVIEKEAAVISLLGLAAGFLVSLAAGYLIHRVYGLMFEYSLAWAATAAGIGLLGGVLGALYPAVRAANLDPVNALSYE
ncbi:MAG TPA: ABC transporter permease [Pyrinomonadaceae bacterium]|nr:ABC transporter permease [Pyrinomonadaceae bacterium]